MKHLHENWQSRSKENYKITLYSLLIIEFIFAKFFLELSVAWGTASHVLYCELVTRQERVSKRKFELEDYESEVKHIAFDF